MITRRVFGTILALVVVAAAVAGGVLWGRRQHNTPAASAAAEAAPAHAARTVPVSVVQARAMTFESRLVTSGSLLAKDYALVSARRPGALDAVYVDEGDAVTAGRTQLFQTDSLNLTKAVEIARQG
ncbi:MAG TPA: hypothetical protein PLP01_15955, partial [Phycisphaerae bacterium]|nr:hypothetical protein [Phycisphaerae bacterium]